MQHNMMLCQREKCIFLSYDPRFKEASEQIHVVEVLANKERQQEILQKIELAHDLKNNIQLL
jgi:hypothetical protein